VPVNFRLVTTEIEHILADSGARAVIVEDALADRVEPIAGTLPARLICLGQTRAGFGDYESLLAGASAAEPGVEVLPDDPWVIMYTSGTTGRPKGAVQSHQSAGAIAFVTILDFGFTPTDTPLLVMPLCHANSLYFFVSFACMGAPVCVHSRRSFDPEEVLRTLSRERISFTSLVPTHYITMLGLPAAVRARHGGEEVRRLLISSASARLDTKRAIMEHFSSSRLFELYGSTEAGWVTLLRPEEQVTRIGSVGREFTGSGRVKLLDDAGRAVPEGEVGELYSRTPYTFSGYWNQPARTAEAFRNGWCTVGDMARRDADGFYHLVDRKRNMIISGGENVYPSEVENVLGGHPAVADVAVIGVPHARWGEAVHAVVVLAPGVALSESELIEWARGRMAGYKRPRSVELIGAAEMPRTATGKILHRALRDRHRS
jgi:acyl-CoA synthetase (AMP-forming)/AMP-acid ligase II